MHFSCHLPIADVTGGFQSMTAVATVARELESSGMDAAHLTDHPAPDSSWLHAHGHDALDPFTGLAFIAAHTQFLKLHTNIIVLPYRNPFMTAKAAASLQVLSDNRLILGVGVGYQKVEFDALGVDFGHRGRLMDEALDALRQIWAGEAVTLRGHTFEAINVEARPVPHPPPAVWVGGGSARAVERAAMFGDGWSPFLASEHISQINRATAIVTTDDLAAKVRSLYERRAELGRSGPFEIALDLGGQHHPLDRSDGEVRRFAEMIGEYASIGVDWVMIKPQAPDVASFVELVQWYGAEVIPAARKTAAAARSTVGRL